MPERTERTPPRRRTAADKQTLRGQLKFMLSGGGGGMDADNGGTKPAACRDLLAACKRYEQQVNAGTAAEYFSAGWRSHPSVASSAVRLRVKLWNVLKGVSVSSSIFKSTNGRAFALFASKANGL